MVGHVVCHMIDHVIMNCCRSELRKHFQFERTEAGVDYLDSGVVDDDDGHVVFSHWCTNAGISAQF